MTHNLIKSLLGVLLAVVTATSACATDFGSSLRRDYWLGQARDRSLGAERRIALYDSLIARSPRDAALYFEQGSLLQEMGLYSRAMRTYERIGDIVSPDSVSLYSKYLNYLAATQYYSNFTEEAVKNCYRILSIRKPDSLTYFDMEANRLLAHIFSEVSPELRREYMRRADRAYERFARSDAPARLKELKLGFLHYSRCSMAIDDRDYPTAFREIKLSRELMGKYEPLGMTAINMACIYHHEGELDMAEKYYREVLDVKDYHPDYMSAVSSYAGLLLERGDVEGASRLLSQYRREMDMLVGTPWEGGLYNIRYRVAEASGDLATALGELKKAYILADSLYTGQSRHYLDNLAEKYEGRDRDSVNARLSSRVTALGAVAIALGALLLGALVALGLVWRRMRRSAGECRVMREELKAHRAIREEEARRASESIGERSRQLSAMTIHMTRLNEVLNNIEHDVDDGSLGRDELAARIKGSLKTLSAQENVWEMFRVYFEEVNQKFFDRLFKACPELTKAEVRMCAFMLAGMTSKEIAIVTSRSVRTVDCIKYNLRRKLNITEPTETFIRRLSAE